MMARCDQMPGRKREALYGVPESITKGDGGAGSKDSKSSNYSLDSG